MSEPVKIVIVMEGGSVQTVLSAGVPVDYAVLDYDVSKDYGPDDIFECPQLDADPVEAIGHIGSAETQFPAHALAMFEAVQAKEARP